MLSENDHASRHGSSAGRPRKVRPVPGPERRQGSARRGRGRRSTDGRWLRRARALLDRRSRLQPGSRPRPRAAGNSLTTRANLKGWELSLLPRSRMTTALRPVPAGHGPADWGARHSFPGTAGSTGPRRSCCSRLTRQRPEDAKPFGDPAAEFLGGGNNRSIEGLRRGS